MEKINNEEENILKVGEEGEIILTPEIMKHMNIKPEDPVTFEIIDDERFSIGKYRKD